VVLTDRESRPTIDDRVMKPVKVGERGFPAQAQGLGLVRGSAATQEGLWTIFLCGLFSALRIVKFFLFSI
jgi:hypothetical protein